MQSIYEHLNDGEESTLITETRSLPPPGVQPLSAHQIAEWRWANVDNMDLFLQKVYEYYNYRGFYCIILSRALQMATVAFVVWFSTYVYSCIDYTKLRHASSFSQARVPRCLAKTSWAHYLSLWAFSVAWILKLFQYVGDVRHLWEMHEFYHHLLHISENEIQTISWQQVVDRIVNSKSINGALSRKIDVHQIVNRIMRKENYMIAMYNKNVLDLEIEIPFLHIGKSEFLTKILEWSIFLCLDDYIFNDRNHVRSIVLKENQRDVLAQGLRRRFQFAALMNVVLAPIAVVYMTLYYFFRYFNEYYSTPKNLGSRQYTPLAEWRFRELNELYHLFRRRISMSEPPAQRYISQFPRYKTELVLKFVIFVLSSFAAVLLAISVYDSELLSLELKLYLTTLGLAIVIARAMLPEPSEQAIYDPETSMRQIIEFTHYMPDSWEGKLHTEPIKTEFCELYDLKPKIIGREILSVLINPVILWYKLADRSERLIDFFREFSVKVDDLGGHVCSLAVFNTDRVSKVKERSDALDNFYATQDGKVLKSYLNFMDIYGAPNHRGTYSSRAPSAISQPQPLQTQPQSMQTQPSPSKQARQPPAHPERKYNSSFERRPISVPSSSVHSSSDSATAHKPVSGALAPSPVLSPTSSTSVHSLALGSAVSPAPAAPAAPEAPEAAPFASAGHPFSMEGSVMYNYEHIRQQKDLLSIREDPSSVADSFNSNEDDDEDDGLAKDGVIGLLNNLYKR